MGLRKCSVCFYFQKHTTYSISILKMLIFGAVCSALLCPQPRKQNKVKQSQANKQTKITKLKIKQNENETKPNQTKVNNWEGSSGGYCWVLACFCHVFGTVWFREPEFSLYPLLYSSLSFCKMGRGRTTDSIGFLRLREGLFI